MFRLVTLGHVQLLDANGSPVEVHRRKPVALLVYLAAMPPGRLVRRDQLIALLWPELDDVAARHSLRQALYYLGRSLGADAIVRHGEEELGLSLNHVWSDVRAFEDSVATGDAETAVALYRGDFLPGYHVDRASPELDEWIQRTRNRLCDLAIHAG